MGTFDLLKGDNSTVTKICSTFTVIMNEANKIIDFVSLYFYIYNQFNVVRNFNF